MNLLKMKISRCHVKTAPGDLGIDYCISCSNDSNSGVEKKVPNVMSSPSHSFLIVTMDTSRLRSSIMLYTVDGVMPANVASSFGFMPLSWHSI